MDELSEDDKLTVARARKIQRFMSQPFQVAQVFTGFEGKFVALKESISAFKRIVAGEFDALPEGAFYMVGGLDDVEKKAQRLAAEAAARRAADSGKKDDSKAGKPGKVKDAKFEQAKKDWAAEFARLKAGEKSDKTKLLPSMADIDAGLSKDKADGIAALRKKGLLRSRKGKKAAAAPKH